MRTRTRWIVLSSAILLGLASLYAFDLGPWAWHNPAGRWVDLDGRVVPDGRRLVLSIETGSGHCGWNGTFFMWLAWPLDRPVVVTSPDRRLYIWQTDDAYPATSLAAEPMVVTEMPADAKYTGLHRGGWQLWVSESRLDLGVFVTDGETIQRWASASHAVFCE